MVENFVSPRIHILLFRSFDPLGRKYLLFGTFYFGRIAGQNHSTHPFGMIAGALHWNQAVLGVDSDCCLLDRLMGSHRQSIDCGHALRVASRRRGGSLMFYRRQPPIGCRIPGRVPPYGAAADFDRRHSRPRTGQSPRGVIFPTRFGRNPDSHPTIDKSSKRLHGRRNQRGWPLFCLPGRLLTLARRDRPDP